MRVFLLLWLCVLQSLTPAMASALRWVNAEQGLQNQSVLALAEDSNGLMWIGTEDGLYRLTDRRLRRVDLQGSRHLFGESFIQALLPLPNHQMLVATDESIYHFDLFENRAVPLAASLKLPAHTTTTRFYLDTQDNIWFISTEGVVFRLAPELDLFEVIGTLPPAQHWRELYRDEHDRLWAMSRHQLVSLEGRSLASRDNLWPSQRGELRGIAADGQGRVWLASYSGLYQLDVVRGAVARKPLLDVPLRDIDEDGNGGLWLLGRGELYHWAAGAPRPVKVELDLPSNFRSESLFATQVDSQGRLWLISSYDGLVGYRHDAPFLLEQINTETHPNIGHDMTWDIYAKGPMRYLATDGGVQWVNRDSGEHGTVTLPEMRDAGAAFALWPMDEQTLVVASTEGLYQLDTERLEARPLTDMGLPNLRQNLVYNLIDDGHQVWIVTDRYLYRWWPAQQRSERFELDGEPLLGVRNLARGPDGRLWFGGENLLAYQGPEGEFTRVLTARTVDQRKHSIGFLAPQPDGSLWFGSYGRGVWMYDPRWREFRHLSEQWKLDCDSAYFGALVEGQMVIGCSRNLFVVEPHLQTLYGLDPYDGLGLNDFNESALFYDSEAGGLMLGGVNGVVVVDPKALAPQPKHDRAIIESLEVHYLDGHRQLWLQPEGRLINIEPDYQLLALQFASNRQLDRTPKHFRYRLNHNGVVGELVDFPNQGQLTFSGLKPGRYELELYGVSQGIWSVVPSRVSFMVNQHWWQSEPVKALAGSALVAFLMLGLLQRQRQVRRIRQFNTELSQSQQRLHLALSAGRSDTWEWDKASNRFRLENHQRCLGEDDEPRLLEMNQMTIHPDDRLRVWRAWREHYLGLSEHYDVEYRQADLQGRWRWIWAAGKAVERDERNGQARRVVGIYSDMTAHRRLEEEHGLYAQAIENTAEGVVILDHQLMVQGCNPAAEMILATPRARLMGDRFHHYWYREQGPQLDAVTRGNASWQGEVLLRGSAGETVPVWLNISPMGDNARHLVALFSDITERKRAELELRRLADFDPLTGLPNRSQFNTRLHAAVQARGPGGRPMALMFLDLDRFKHINDTYGHSTGDGLLVQAAQRLKGLMGDSELLCRFGGDEFIVLISEFRTRAELERLAQRVLSAIAEPFELDGQLFYVSTSVGIACFPDDAQQPETLIRHADLAMYHAKEEGRGRYSFYTPQRDAQATYQLELENALRQALEANQLELHYQPQVDLQTGQVTGVEALLRWFDEENGAVPPDTFITLAESSGIIVKLDRWALRQACQSFVRWGLGDGIKLSVNVSASHFHQPDYVDFVSRVLTETGLPASQLCLEITEGVLMKRVSLAQSHLHALRRLGVSVAVDDFGTGYSSLAYLSQFAVDSLKIDRSFVHDLPGNLTNGAITRSILDMGRNLGLQVVAEGVETEEQEAFLRHQGCARMQGFRYARPMNAEACCLWLQERAEQQECESVS
ncbi:diguanylate cyclase/phosphodiesterase with PAS/PAC sensor(s) [Ferrimonas balearica DSM 9799]|uniref:cyclic-guanylate-specific phosphodiesterase n=1 Tax=Ferrimonas balearica (strain DSM 9799 / CCM 4581 / KCTC 23876 / PAT) TaxID=550540 RepID=E1SN88_FERBD|nr:EAL domain-containing protein [Ferrimonas balearica]ADN74587.1 diguanylate cyclase/phosphodiesterase with PAS/PAC sensor(s) [Ferrimonas balearica DSM 9799]